MADNSKILVIIPCLNEELYLEKLVQHLEASNNSPNMHIIIVDGGSTDQTPDIGRKLAHDKSNIHYIENPKRIQSAAINCAVATFGGDAEFLIRIDAHADYPKHYCDILIDEATATKADSIVVSMHTVGKTPFQKAAALAQNSKLGNGGSAHRMIDATMDVGGRWVDHGHHALIRIAAFQNVGGYDETFTHNEDAELDMRLNQKDYKIWLTSKTSLTYYPRATPFALFKQYMNYGYGRACTLFKHSVRPKLRQLLPALVAPAALLALATPVISMAALPLVAWILLCLGYSSISAIKAKDPSILLMGFAAMIMHFSWSLGFWKAMLTRAIK